MCPGHTAAQPINLAARDNFILIITYSTEIH